MASVSMPCNPLFPSNAVALQGLKQALTLDDEITFLALDSASALAKPDTLEVRNEMSLTNAFPLEPPLRVGVNLGPRVYGLMRV